MPCDRFPRKNALRALPKHWEMAEKGTWRAPKKDSTESDDSENESQSKSISKARTCKTNGGPIVDSVQPLQREPRKFTHPVYKTISKCNNLVNHMETEEICRKLAECGLNGGGSHEVVSKRLKNWLKARELREANMNQTQNPIDFIIVIDFEATCEKDNPPNFIQEIIEFPAVLVNVHARQIVCQFHSYCRPTINSQLTNFCKDLTGITQIKVESAPRFPTVLRRFDEWVKTAIAPGSTFAILTDGPWDIAKFLKVQCKQSKLEMPYYSNRWINIRKHFRNYYKTDKVNLEGMLDYLGMKFQGRPHSGIDDTYNIACIAIQLLEDGCDMRINETFS